MTATGEKKNHLRVSSELIWVEMQQHPNQSNWFWYSTHRTKTYTNTWYVRIYEMRREFSTASAF